MNDDQHDGFVDLRQSAEAVNAICGASDDWVVDLDATCAEIHELYRKHMKSDEPNEHVMAEIGNDERTPPWVLADIVGRFASCRVTMIGVAVKSVLSAASLFFLERGA